MFKSTFSGSYYRSGKVFIPALVYISVSFRTRFSTRGWEIIADHNTAINCNRADRLCWFWSRFSKIFLFLKKISSCFRTMVAFRNKTSLLYYCGLTLREAFWVLLCYQLKTLRLVHFFTVIWWIYTKISMVISCWHTSHAQYCTSSHLYQ